MEHIELIIDGHRVKLDAAWAERLDGLYRDEAGCEVWRIRGLRGEVVAEGVASDNDAKWIAEQVELSA